MTPTNSLTRAIITYLNYSGFKVWRNNNGAVYSVKQKTFRKNPTTLLGIPDIIGYKKRSINNAYPIFVAIEVKTGKDRVSPQQEIFLVEIVNEGGIAFVANSMEDFELKIYSHIDPQFQTNSNTDLKYLKK